MSAKSVAHWDEADLVRRVLRALNVACRTIRTFIDSIPANCGTSATQTLDVPIREKAVAETAMLLVCVEPLRRFDERIRELVDVIAALLIPYARHNDVLAAICLDPGLARDHSVAHALLSRLGYPDPDVDRLLSASLEMGVDFGPERLPHRRLEQEWLRRAWNLGEPSKYRDSRSLADSMLGRPLDVLGASPFDIYAFTHAVMYSSDLGHRRVVLPRPLRAITADAEAALAFSLDSNDFDLAAEVMLTWPMLRLPWSPSATFAFRILADEEDAIGFLRGRTFDLASYDALTGDDRERFALATSYHTAYVMGFLCALCLSSGCRPGVAVPPARRSRGGGLAVMRLLEPDSSTVCWTKPFRALAPRQHDMIAPLLLATVLRRSRTKGDLRLMREALEVALAYDLVDGPAPRQAAALLRRSQALKCTPFGPDTGDSRRA